MSDTKKYYWLKLKRDFFKRHDITVIEALPNGDKYLLFYMKLLVESIDHEGALRFSDTVPYNDTMLSAITHTDIDIVRSAVKVFEQFGMMDMLDDGTLFLKQVETMIGDETNWAEKKRLYREKQKLIGTNEGQKKTLSDKSIDKEKELEKELEKDIRGQKEKPPATYFQKPTIEEIKTYCQERKNNIVPEKWLSHYESNGWMIGKNKMKDWKAAIRTWENNDINGIKKPVNTSKPETRLCPHCHVPLRGSACPQCYANFDMNGKEI